MSNILKGNGSRFKKANSTLSKNCIEMKKNLNLLTFCQYSWSKKWFMSVFHFGAGRFGSIENQMSIRRNEILMKRIRLSQLRSIEHLSMRTVFWSFFLHQTFFVPTEIVHFLQVMNHATAIESQQCWMFVISYSNVNPASQHYTVWIHCQCKYTIENLITVALVRLGFVVCHKQNDWNGFEENVKS